MSLSSAKSIDMPSSIDDIAVQISDLNTRTDSMKSAATDIKTDDVKLSPYYVKFLDHVSFFEDEEWIATKEIKAYSITNTVQTLIMLRDDSYKILAYINYVWHHGDIGASKTALKTNLQKLDNDLNSSILAIKIVLDNLQVESEMNDKTALSSFFKDCASEKCNYTTEMIRVYVLMSDCERFMQYQHAIFNFMESSFTNTS